MSVDELQTRVDELRGNGVEGKELIDAIIEVAQKQFFRPELVIDMGLEVIELSRPIGYREGEAWGHGIVGMGQYMLSRHREALHRFFESERLAGDSADPRLQSGVATGLAGVYLSLGDFEHALEYGIRALRLARATGNTYDEAWLHHGISTAYADLGDLERALDHARQGRELFERLYSASKGVPHLVGIGRCLSAEGAALIARGDVDDAEPLHSKALDIFRQTDNEIGEARALNDLGLIAFEKGDYRQSESHHRKSLEIREKINNVQSQSTSLLNLAKVFLATGRVDESLSTLHEALSRAEESGARVRIYQIYEALADTCETLGDIRQALAYHRQFHSLREEVMGESVTARIKNLQIAFEIEQSEREAELIRRKNQELRATNDELNRLLDELQRAQDRLVQSEKMASLGQLTAGIAHEIKNPLNFVTNFASMNVELIEELRGVMSSTGSDDDDEADELIADVIENSRRILEHSRRADSIIRSMLMHARGGSGEIGLVKFNGFVDEYVKLAYHGFRAQNPDFNVSIETAYDPEVGSLKINASDIGRVILNVVNNAFFALNEQIPRQTPDFSPTVTLSTSVGDGIVELHIRDNGPGIPVDIASRIFEPFFTTKAAGEGTGLGLSLSYDIVVQGHGGEMYVESEPGSYTEFVIRLPSSTGHEEAS
ncbi:MAG TPA: tetratricopeptide repeat protein [Rhodothermia bacterium]